MRNSSAIFLGKSLSKISRLLNKGHGSTWPGHIALKINKRFIEDLLKKSNTKIIFVAGTNGKTTSTRMIRTILEENGASVIHNESGANLLNGIASSLLLKSNVFLKIKADYAIFEIDENALPHVLQKVQPHFLIVLNLFRDQLDRYGEVDSIAKKWSEAISRLLPTTTLILNADDPQVAYLSEKSSAVVKYFGLSKRLKGNTSIHAADSLYCPRCSNKLSYNYKLYSHLGDWYCRKCDLHRPEIEKIDIPNLPLSGMYNEYNTTAVVLLSKLLSISDEKIEESLRHITPAFGRQEIIRVKDKNVQLFLSKNPTGFNESLRTIAGMEAKHLLLLLNDHTADGHDVSWIWDVDFESFIPKFDSVTISGNRAYDMGLRIKYCQIQDTTSKIQTDLELALKHALNQTPQEQTLFILPTYTAMLEIRKILKGRSIL